MPFTKESRQKKTTTTKMLSECTVVQLGKQIIGNKENKNPAANGN